MPEIPADDEQTKEEDHAAPQSAARSGRKFFRLTLWVPVLLAAIVLFLMYGLDHFPSVARTAKRFFSDRKLGPLFTRFPADQLLSSDNVLRSVGRSPVDPGRVLSPSLESLSGSQAERTPGPSSPDAEETVDPEGRPKSRTSTGEEKSPSDAGPGAAVTRSPKQPSVESREPGPTDPSSREGQKEKPEPTQGSEATPNRASTDSRGPTPTVGRFDDRDKTERVAGARRVKRPAEDVTSAGPQATHIEPTRTDQFQLPGSLTVKIQNYSGTIPKWGLMVILDDSASMARKRRAWSPNRLHSGQTLVEKLPDTLERGSKIAIRDFMCSKRDEKPSAPDHGCLSHMLYEWAASPFKGLKEKLAQNDAHGQTNPCAAAAYSLKRDFGSLGGLSPRLLLITDGTRRCAFKEVLGAIEKQMGRDKLCVDVLALGMHRKRQMGYAKLAERTNGLFFRIDNPSDVQAAMVKYGKLLKTPIKEKLEVRGGKTVLTANPDEEITLVPGDYTVVLPAVAGISPAKRTIEAVQIRSGESSVVQIRVKKGRPVAKIEKK